MGMSEALNPQVFNLTLTSADTEYSQLLPKGTKYWSAQCRTAVDTRFQFITGKVATPTAPWATIKSGQSYSQPEKAGWSQTATNQVDTVTMAGTWANGDTITSTIGGRTVVVTIGTLVTTTQVALTFKQAWENETLTDSSASVTPERGGQQFLETSNFTATSAAAIVTLTNDKQGDAATLVVTESTASNGTATEASTAATSEQATLYFAGDVGGEIMEIVTWQDIR